jgi:hypothetical protein
MKHARAIALVATTCLILIGCGPSVENVPLPPATTAASAPRSGGPTVKLAPVIDGRDSPEVSLDNDTHYQIANQLPDYVGQKVQAQLEAMGFNVVNTDPNAKGSSDANTVVVTLLWATSRGKSDRIAGSLEIRVQIKNPSNENLYTDRYKGSGEVLGSHSTTSGVETAIGVALERAADIAVAQLQTDSDLAKAARPAEPVLAQDGGAAPVSPKVDPGVVVAQVSSLPITGRRIALVVGNSKYQNVRPLPNPANDANLMANTLKKLGFELVGQKALVNLDKHDFDTAIQSFGHRLPGSSVALFYYAGHGFQIDGKNYLVPVTAKLTYDKTDLDFQMVDAQTILNEMDTGDKRLNVMVLDACRDNPFHGTGENGTRSLGGSGLAELKAPQGTLISYATAPEHVALDGDGPDSIYTAALAQSIQIPGIKIQEAFNNVGVAVLHQTSSAQQPWISSSPIEGAFYFVPDSAPSIPPGAPPPTSGVSSATPGVSAAPVVERPASPGQPGASNTSPGPETDAVVPPPESTHDVATTPSPAAPAIGEHETDASLVPAAAPSPVLNSDETEEIETVPTAATKRPAHAATRIAMRKRDARTPYHILIHKTFNGDEAKAMTERIRSLGYAVDAEPIESDDQAGQTPTAYQITVGAYHSEDEAQDGQDEFESRYSSTFGSAPPR